MEQTSSSTTTAKSIRPADQFVLEWTDRLNTAERRLKDLTNRRTHRRSGYRLTEPLTDDERAGIVLAVNSAFRKLKNLYLRIQPLFLDFGFTPPSAGVIARDLSEKIETAIVQHCNSFQPGNRFADLQRNGRPWEVKICKDTGLTINQSKVVDGESYIVVNYKADSVVVRVWVLWEAADGFFSPRRANSNARTVVWDAAGDYIEVLFEAPGLKRRAAEVPLQKRV